MRRPTRALILALAAVSISLVAPSQVSSSAPANNPRAERERVRAEKAKLAGQIDVNKASLSEIDDALQAIEANLRTQQAALARTEAEVAQAEQDIRDAEAASSRLATQLTKLKAEMRRRAVAAYVSPPTDDVLTVLDTQDFTTASNRKFYIQLRSLDDADVADRIDGARSDLAYQRRKAAAAKRRAEAKRAEQAKRTDAVRSARAAQARIADRMQATIDAQVARSLDLAKTDRALSAQIAQQQAALVARLAAQRAAAAAAQRAAAAQAAAASSGSSSSGGGAIPPATVTPGSYSDGIQLAYVQGVPVNAAVAAQVTAMINAAAADGVNLQIGNSYRPVSQQIALRQQHCGSSYYAIYLMPSGSCHPPTAPPGHSQHQLGLAIDFANCSSRGSACYRWLAANASRFGYYNLPSEAWHWSTTGR